MSGPSPGPSSSICDFGRVAPDFSLPGTDGRSWGLADVRGPAGTVIMFICNHCPYVQAILPHLVTDMAALQQQGIGVAAIMPNDTVAYPADSFDNMKMLAEARGFSFPYLIDETQAVARAYDAVCTPDFFGYDKDLGLQYRGRLDVSKVTPVPGARRDLVEAMRQVAATGHGPQDQVASMGCSIKWKPA